MGRPKREWEKGYWEIGSEVHGWWEGDRIVLCYHFADDDPRAAMAFEPTEAAQRKLREMDIVEVAKRWMEALDKIEEPEVGQEMTDRQKRQVGCAWWWEGAFEWKMEDEGEVDMAALNRELLGFTLEAE